MFARRSKPISSGPRLLAPRSVALCNHHDDRGRPFCGAVSATRHDDEAPIRSLSDLLPQNLHERRELLLTEATLDPAIEERRRERWYLRAMNAPRARLGAVELGARADGVRALRSSHRRLLDAVDARVETLVENCSRALFSRLERVSLEELAVRPLRLAAEATLL